MSQEAVALVRRVYEANDRGDFTAVFAAYDPEIEWHVLRVAEWRQWLSAWETTSFEYDEFIDAGEHVVVVQSQHMRDRASPEGD